MERVRGAGPPRVSLAHRRDLRPSGHQHALPKGASQSRYFTLVLGLQRALNLAQLHVLGGLPRFWAFLTFAKDAKRLSALGMIVVVRRVSHWELTHSRSSPTSCWGSSGLCFACCPGARHVLPPSQVAWPLASTMAPEYRHLLVFRLVWSILSLPCVISRAQQR